MDELRNKIFSLVATFFKFFFIPPVNAVAGHGQALYVLDLHSVSAILPTEILRMSIPAFRIMII